MSDLTARDRELVALGAAMGSNCVPCIEYHIRESLKIGFTHTEINAAIEQADKVRQVPARKVHDVARKHLSGIGSTTGGCGDGGGQAEKSEASSDCGCSEEALAAASKKAPSPASMMASMMGQGGKCC